MSIFASPRFLPTVLRIDAATCLASGALQLAATGPLADLLGLDAALLRGTGWFLLAYGAAVLWLAARPVLPRPLVWAIVAGNLLWALDCVLLVAAGWARPTPLGLAYVAVQAVTVVGLAELQWLGLRRAPRAAGW